MMYTHRKLCHLISSTTAPYYPKNMSSYVESWSMEEQAYDWCQRLQALADNRAGEIQRFSGSFEKNRAIIAQKAQIQLMEKMNKNLVKALGTE